MVLLCIYELGAEWQLSCGGLYPKVILGIKCHTKLIYWVIKGQRPRHDPLCNDDHHAIIY